MKSTKRIRPVILAGGSGKRLWPVSRESKPKQFQKFSNDFSLFQQTLLRLKNLKYSSKFEFLKPLIVTNLKYQYLVLDQLKEIKMDGKIILEPISKNTAPAICIAALFSKKEDYLLVLPSDHELHISEEESFSLDDLAGLEEDKLICFGVKPRKPSTQYGYIERGKTIDKDIYSIKKFKEKPNDNLAKTYFRQKKFFWNSGIFFFKSDAILDEFMKCIPSVYKSCLLSLKKSKKEDLFIYPDKDSLKNCPSISIDYAVLEKTKNIVVKKINNYWSDLGSWEELISKKSGQASISKKSDVKNKFIGDVVSKKTKNSLVYSPDKLTVLNEIEDLVFVDTPDAVYISKKGKSEKINVILNKLAKEDFKEVQEHKEVLRPWGSYDSIDIGKGYQVKKIIVNPKQKLSLQFHNKRSEHWVVVQGVAEVTKGEKTFNLRKNQSIFIEKKEKHSLKNPGSKDLVLIEIQCGDYLGEDDIVRLEDIYGRA